MPSPKACELASTQPASRIPTATLKDLCPSEKAKIAQLMHKIVEQGQQLQELHRDTAKQRKLLEESEAEQQHLRVQNNDIARENSSLKAKLTHAFALLKAYQHKVRAMHMAIHSANSRQSEGSNGYTIWSLDHEKPIQDCNRDACCKACGLSPIKETEQERASPCSVHTATCSSSMRDKSQWSTVSQGEQCHNQQPQEQQQKTQQAPGGAKYGDNAFLPLQNLEPLTLLAKALLEAQADILTSKHQRAVASLGGHAKQAQQQPEPFQSGQQGQQVVPPSLVAASGATTCCGHLTNSTTEPCRINAATSPVCVPDALAEASCSQCHHNHKQQQQFIVCTEASPVLGAAESSPPNQDNNKQRETSSQQQLPASQHAKAARHASALPQHSLHQQGLWQREQLACSQQCCPDFDPSLLDVVRDVEGMLGAGTAQAAAPLQSAAAFAAAVGGECSNGGGPPVGAVPGGSLWGRRWGGSWGGELRSAHSRQCGRSAVGGLPYDETDLLSIIDALN